MADLTTKYLGLTLSNPIIVASSGLTDSVDKIKNLELNGAGAVVLKSLFEEQILREANFKIKKAQEDGLMYAEHSETFDYIDLHVKEKTVNEYIDLIKGAKQAVNIPLIASVNCITAHEWTSFAKNIEKAGADALELNIFIMPFSLDNDCRDTDKVYYEIVEKIKNEISIPVAVKLSPFFSNLGYIIRTLDKKGVDGIVLFNRFSRPDIDIENIKVVPASIYSTPEEIYSTLRWIGILGNRVNCDLAASTGVHDGEAVIKQLLAGADAVQVASALYKNGPEHIVKMKNTLDQWMMKKGYHYIDQFKGKLSQEKSQDPEAFERIQFMKYFSKIVK
jgi:dihydroorotate dehydrogenase (fumarate)